MVFNIFEVGSKGFVRHRAAVASVAGMLLVGGALGISYTGYRTISSHWVKPTPVAPRD